MSWLTDPKGRRGIDLVGFRIGNVLALLIVCALVAGPVAWWFSQVLR